jgi:hypothetical protein
MLSALRYRINYQSRCTDGTLATRIESAFDAAEAVELEAAQIECRICQIAGADRLLPRRQYGKPVSAASINANLTLSALINRSDPKLAAYLGIQNGQAQAQPLLLLRHVRQPLNVWQPLQQNYSKRTNKPPP